MGNRRFWWFVEEENENGERQVFTHTSPRKNDEGSRFECPRSTAEMPRIQYLHGISRPKRRKGVPGTVQVQYASITFVNEDHPRAFNLDDFLWNKNELCKTLRTSISDSVKFAAKVNKEFGMNVKRRSRVDLESVTSSEDLSEKGESTGENKEDDVYEFEPEKEAIASTPKTSSSSGGKSRQKRGQPDESAKMTASGSRDKRHKRGLQPDTSEMTSSGSKAKRTKKSGDEVTESTQSDGSKAKRTKKSGDEVAASTSSDGSKAKRKQRTLPTDFEKGAVTPLIDVASNDLAIDPQAAMKEEIKAANLGEALISLSCLRITNNQVRQVDNKFVAQIVKSMEEHSDHAYQPYCVVTKSLKKKNNWTQDKANGFVYEILGGQHNFKATTTMKERYPKNELFSFRRCQVYFGGALSFEAKCFLGVMHNKVGDVRKGTSSKEEMILCRRLRRECSGDDKRWKSLCSKVVVSVNPSGKDFNTIINLAKKEEETFDKIINVIQAYEDGILDRRVMKEDTAGGVVKFPLYHLRTFGDQMSSDVANQMLDLVSSKSIPLAQLDRLAKNTQQLQNIQAALMGEIFGLSSNQEKKTWEEFKKRFPQHSKREDLLSQFGKVKMGKYTHPAIKAWAQNCLRWEKMVEKEEAIGSHQDKFEGTDGSIGYLVKADATALNTNELKKLVSNPLPTLRLCVLDKPENWTIDQLAEAVVSITSVRNQTTEMDFTLVVLCEVDEIVAVKECINTIQQYNHIVDCYYYVENSTSSGVLTPTVYGFVIANREMPITWKWSNGTSHNFMMINQDKKYVNSDTKLVVDQKQKPLELYMEVISAVTTKQQWVVDLCSGTGTGMIAALRLGRNIVSIDIDTNQIMHARGRVNTMMVENQKGRDEGRVDIDSDGEEGGEDNSGQVGQISKDSSSEESDIKDSSDEESEDIDSNGEEDQDIESNGEEDQDIESNGEEDQDIESNGEEDQDIESNGEEDQDIESNGEEDIDSDGEEEDKDGKSDKKSISDAEETKVSSGEEEEREDGDEDTESKVQKDNSNVERENKNDSDKERSEEDKVKDNSDESQ